MLDEDHYDLPEVKDRILEYLEVRRLHTVILSKRNARDLDELPDDVHETLTFVRTETVDEAIETALRPVAEEARP